MSSSSVDEGLWCRRFHPAPDGGDRLVCFPHAGGSASFHFPVAGGGAELPRDRDRGDEDPKTSLEEALAWEDHTRGGFDLQVLPGGHFYLTDQQTEVMRLLSDHLASTAVSGRPS